MITEGMFELTMSGNHPEQENSNVYILLIAKIATAVFLSPITNAY